MANLASKIIKNSKNLLSQFYKNTIIDFGDYQKSIFIAGSARSGTTWLQDIVNYDNQYRIMFEPFHPNKVDCVEDWKYFQYIRTNDNSEQFLLPMEKILSGKFRNNWVDRFNNKKITKTRIIKAIHANLFLSWMKNYFPEIPILLILRHPCAVANSKINIARDFFRNTVNPLDRFLSQNELMEDFLYPFECHIKEAKTDFETYIFMWCIENYVPLKQFQPGQIYIAFYENLCVTPGNEVRKIFSFLGDDYSPDVMDRVFTPSVMSRESSAIKTGHDLISSWRKYINVEQIERALEILNLFGLDILYKDHDLPLLENDKVFNKFD